MKLVFSNLKQGNKMKTAKLARDVVIHTLGTFEKGTEVTVLKQGDRCHVMVGTASFYVDADDIDL